MDGCEVSVIAAWLSEPHHVAQAAREAKQKDAKQLTPAVLGKPPVFGSSTWWRWHLHHASEKFLRLINETYAGPRPAGLDQSGLTLPPRKPPDSDRDPARADKSSDRLARQCDRPLADLFGA